MQYGVSAPQSAPLGKPWLTETSSRPRPKDAADQQRSALCWRASNGSALAPSGLSAASRRHISSSNAAIRARFLQMTTTFSCGADAAFGGHSIPHRLGKLPKGIVMHDLEVLVFMR